MNLFEAFMLMATSAKVLFLSLLLGLPIISGLLCHLKGVKKGIALVFDEQKKELARQELSRKASKLRSAQMNIACQIKNELSDGIRNNLEYSSRLVVNSDIDNVASRIFVYDAVVNQVITRVTVDCDTDKVRIGSTLQSRAFVRTNDPNDPDLYALLDQVLKYVRDWKPPVFA